MSEDKAYDMWKELYAAKAEIDRLRAENAAYKTTQTNIMENKAWLIEELYRLRAENRELREALQEFDHYDLDEPILKIVEGLRAILAKTAKEGETTSAASDPGSQTRE